MQEKKNPITKTIDEYEKISRKIYNLKIRQSEMGAKLVDHFQTQDVKNHKSEQGTISLGVRKSWKYTPSLVACEDALKKSKLAEQAEGLATVKETPYISYKMAK